MFTSFPRDDFLSHTFKAPSMIILYSFICVSSLILELISSPIYTYSSFNILVSFNALKLFLIDLSVKFS